MQAQIILIIHVCLAYNMNASVRSTQEPPALCPRHGALDFAATTSPQDQNTTQLHRSLEVQTCWLTHFFCDSTQKAGRLSVIADTVLTTTRRYLQIQSHPCM